MQIIFIAFGIYKKHPNYNEDLNYESILKLCDYRYLSEFYGENKDIPHFKELWKLLSKCQNENSNVNKWANFIKHKGGLRYKGLDDFFGTMLLEDCKGNKIRGTEDFAMELLDLDELIDQLIIINNNQVKILSELIDFINFSNSFTIDTHGNIVINNENEYKKVLIN
ncbi:hypothetical protein KQI30_08320 [Clostridium bornimense]|uniref:hypothetical protein n=1 Tax=Clostridium bornimense TaxID=1216932 RepID=UPI001C1089C1|nr:hypothetical protein [Clostridium bornimense]MBU5316274.1 hypothetical protein [Clostridium bornimense]